MALTYAKDIPDLIPAVSANPELIELKSDVSTIAGDVTELALEVSQLSASVLPMASDDSTTIKEKINNIPVKDVYYEYVKNTAKSFENCGNGSLVIVRNISKTGNSCIRVVSAPDDSVSIYSTLTDFTVSLSGMTVTVTPTGSDEAVVAVYRV